MVDWKSLFGLSYDQALQSFKASVGAEVLDQVMSIPDTIAFIEFIYEETAQTLLFALYQAYKAGNYEMARQIWNYAKLEFLPDAVNFVGGWGVLNPATQNCFQRFFDAVELSLEVWDKILAQGPPQEAVLAVYTNEFDVLIKIDGEEKGLAGPTVPVKVKLEPGSHSIEAIKEGFQTEARSVNLNPGEYRAIKINMKPIS